MPLTIIMDNLANLSKHVEAVVNLCHPTPGEIGTGVDAAIHAKAGPRLCERLAQLPRLQVGQFHYTDGYDLTNASGERVKGIFNVLGPLWQNGQLGEEAQLRRCYQDILESAHARGIQSIAFPMISAGNRGFPEDVAYRAATDAFRAFFDEKQHQGIQAYLVIFSGKVVDYCKRQTQIEEVVDSETVDAILKEVYTVPVETTYERMLASFLRWITLSGKFDQYFARHPQENAIQTLTGLANLFLEANPKLSEAKLCKRGNLNERHFSNNVRNHPRKDDPTVTLPKATLLAYAVALGLNESQTRELLYRGQHLFDARFPVDKVVMECMKQGKADISTVNEMLANAGMPALGRQ